MEKSSTKNNKFSKESKLMLVYTCETINHRGSSVNESYDNTFARKRLYLKSNTVIKNIQDFGLKFNITCRHFFLYSMSLPTSEMWLKLNNIFKSIYGCSSRWWAFQQHPSFCFPVKNPD